MPLQSINHFHHLQSLPWGWNLQILLYSSCQIEAKSIPSKWKMLHLISHTNIVCVQTSQIEFLENQLNLRNISLSLKYVLLWTQLHELHCAGFVFRLGAFLQLLHFPVLAHSSKARFIYLLTCSTTALLDFLKHHWSPPTLPTTFESCLLVSSHQHCGHCKLSGNNDQQCGSNSNCIHSLKELLYHVAQLMMDQESFAATVFC